MPTEIGHVEAIFRYPVKSMRGESLAAANLGWHGLDGDRRLAFRRLDHHSDFPWLTASKLPDLLLFTPQRHEGDSPESGDPANLPTHIRTPDGNELPVFGQELAAEVGRRYGAPVEMMQLKHGIFDDASISVIASDTVREIARLAGQREDVRRFRPNVVVRLLRAGSFQENHWLGGVLSFGKHDDDRRSREPEPGRNLRHGNPHRSPGSRTTRIPPCGDRTLSTAGGPFKPFFG